MTADQKAAAAMRWEEFERAQAKERQRLHGGTAPGKTLVQDSAQVSDDQPTKTRDALAKRAGVSRYKIQQAQTVKRHDGEQGTDLLRQVEAGATPRRSGVAASAPGAS